MGTRAFKSYSLKLYSKDRGVSLGPLNILSSKAEEGEMGVAAIIFT